MTFSRTRGFLFVCCLFTCATLAMAHRSQLEGRLMAILDPTVPRRGLTRARAAAATVLFALFIVPVA